jgi:hypothetical protein
MALYAAFWTSTINVNKAVALLAAAPLTFSGWYAPDSFTADAGVIGFSVTNGSITDTFNLQLPHTQKQVFAETGQSSVYADANDGLAAMSTAGIYYHMAAVFTATTSQAFRNGVGGTPVTSQVPGTLGFTGIGYLPGNQARGAIALTACWNAALTQPEVTALSLGAHPRKIRPSALIACLDLTGYGTSGVTVDRVNNTVPWNITTGFTDTPNVRIFF